MTVAVFLLEHGRRLGPGPFGAPLLAAADRQREARGACRWAVERSPLAGIKRRRAIAVVVDQA